MKDLLSKIEAAGFECEGGPLAKFQPWQDLCAALNAALRPIDMVLHCPACGTQHIDAPERSLGPGNTEHIDWDNPPHRSHLCHSCGHIWRTADVPTNGVKAVQTKGNADHAIVPTIDLQRIFFAQMLEACRNSQWMPPEYSMNDWTADVVRFLREGPEPAPVINGEPATAHSMLAALIDIYDDTQGKPPEHRSYIESAWSDTLKDARKHLAGQQSERPAPAVPVGMDGDNLARPAPAGQAVVIRALTMARHALVNLRINKSAESLALANALDEALAASQAERPAPALPTQSEISNGPHANIGNIPSDYAPSKVKP